MYFGNDGADRHRAPLRHFYRDDTVGFRVQFERDLVGFNLAHRLIFGHPLAILLEPLRHERFSYRFPDGGYFQFHLSTPETAKFITKITS